MRAVHIRVGHDDDLVIAQVVDIEPCAKADPQRLRQVADLGIGAKFGTGRAQHVQDFAAQGQQGLRFAIAAHLGGPARRVALDDE